VTDEVLSQIDAGLRDVQVEPFLLDEHLLVAHSAYAEMIHDTDRDAIPLHVSIVL